MTALIARLRAAGCVYAEEEAALLAAEAASPSELEAWARRRIAGEPLEYVLGWVAFDGLRVGLDAGVFIPRQRTILLVEIASAALDARRAGSDDGPLDPVLDLCCGCGALGLALAHRHPGTVVHAVDAQPTAVTCAARNLAAVGGTVHLGDLDQPLPDALRGEVAVLLANVPYVPSDQVALMPADSRAHEPRSTVDGGRDGLDVLRRVAGLAPGWLRRDGIVVCEIAPGQAAAAAAEFTAAGLAPRLHDDEVHEVRAISGVRAG